jgi:hypothetical protein
MLLLLSRLSLSGVYHAAGLKQLPAAQLCELRLYVGVGVDMLDSDNPLDRQEMPLGHLTGVTMLECSG